MALALCKHSLDVEQLQTVMAEAVLSLAPGGVTATFAENMVQPPPIMFPRRDNPAAAEGAESSMNQDVEAEPATSDAHTKPDSQAGSATTVAAPASGSPTQQPQHPGDDEEREAAYEELVHRHAVVGKGALRPFRGQATVQCLTNCVFCLPVFKHCTAAVANTIRANRKNLDYLDEQYVEWQALKQSSSHMGRTTASACPTRWCTRLWKWCLQRCLPQSAPMEWCWTTCFAIQSGAWHPRYYHTVPQGADKSPCWLALQDKAV